MICMWCSQRKHKEYRRKTGTKWKQQRKKICRRPTIEMTMLSMITHARLSTTWGYAMILSRQCHVLYTSHAYKNKFLSKISCHVSTYCDLFQVEWTLLLFSGSYVEASVEVPFHATATLDIGYTSDIGLKLQTIDLYMHYSIYCRACGENSRRYTF